MTHYHVIPADYAEYACNVQGLRHGSDGCVYLWPTLDLAEDWREEMETSRPSVILTVDLPGPTDTDPYAGSARVYWGDIPASCLSRL